jgi:hypothetical protein
LSNKKKEKWIMEVVELWDKVTWHAPNLTNFFEEKGMINNMDGEKGSKSCLLNRKSRHPMDSKHNECAPFVEYGQSRWLWCGV